MKLYIEGLPGFISKYEIRKFFLKYGEVAEVKKPLGKDGTTITMTNDTEALKALKNLQGKKLLGYTVTIEKCF